MTTHASIAPVIGAFAAAGLISAIAIGALAAQPAHAAVKSVEIDGKVIYNAKAKGKAKSKLPKVVGVTYAAKSKTLTLKNLNLKPQKKASQTHGAIYIAASSGDTVSIKLKGTNTIQAGRADIFGIRTDGKLKLAGTNLTCTDMGTAIQANSVQIGKGTYAFKRCSHAGIIGKRGVIIKGNKGGTVSVTTTTPEQDVAIGTSSGTVKNEYKRLGTIEGKLGAGAKYNHVGSTYQVIDDNKVKLVSYGAGTEADISCDTFGKNTYDVHTIAPRAFANAKGERVTRIKLGPALRVIGKEAFYGTNRLNSIVATRWLGGIMGSLDVLSYDALKTRFGTDDMEIDNRAFKGCGELAGFNLAVHTGIRSTKVNLAVKAALTLKGLPALAQVTA